MSDERLSGLQSLEAWIKDVRVNPRDPKAWIVLLSFRSAQAAMRPYGRPGLASWPLILASRLLCEGILGIELRPTTRVGAGLTIHHGTGLVVNPGAVIGEGVTLRNGVVIGNKGSGNKDGSPTLCDGVDIGANAVVIGPITIGARAVIGAGSVVTRDVPEGAIVAGNPARILRVRD